MFEVLIGIKSLIAFKAFKSMKANIGNIGQIKIIDSIKIRLIRPSYGPH